VTTAYPGDLVLGEASFNNEGTLSAASGTTKRFTATALATAGPAMLGEDLIQTSAGSAAATSITDSLSASAWIGVVIALKPAGAAGLLSVQTSASPSFSANLDSGDQTVSYTLPLSTTASVAPPGGWNETITSTQFTAGGYTLPAGASTIASAPAVACQSSYANCSSPVNSVSYPVAVPAAAAAPTPIKFFNAASGSGAGVFTVTPTISVQIPQNSFAGTYTSTLTIAIANGP
jgi:hypothetical protein